MIYPSRTTDQHRASLSGAGAKGASTKTSTGKPSASIKVKPSATERRAHCALFRSVHAYPASVTLRFRSASAALSSVSQPTAAKAVMTARAVEAQPKGGHPCGHRTRQRRSARSPGRTAPPTAFAWRQESLPAYQSQISQLFDRHDAAPPYLVGPPCAAMALMPPVAATRSTTSPLVCELKIRSNVWLSSRFDGLRQGAHFLPAKAAARSASPSWIASKISRW